MHNENIRKNIIYVINSSNKNINVYTLYMLLITMIKISINYK